jgi:hypothetical protein
MDIKTATKLVKADVYRSRGTNIKLVPDVGRVKDRTVRCVMSMSWRLRSLTAEEGRRLQVRASISICTSDY